MKIHTGDQVVVITGKDKGKVGQVLRVLKNGRVVVSDVNMRTKHIRSQPNRQGQIIKYEASLSPSNVMLIDPKTKKRSRIGFSIDAKGGKKRIAKRSGEAVVVVKEAGKRTSRVTQKEEAKKETKDARETKEGKDRKAERVDAPKKAPFWKGLGFGREALDEAEVRQEPRMKEDRSVPDQGKLPDTFAHQRGE